jgi:hypothetical protein
LRDDGEMKAKTGEYTTVNDTKLRRSISNAKCILTKN